MARIPKDESVMRFEDDQRIVILSVSDAPVNLGDMGKHSTKEVHVFAENVTVIDEFSAKSLTVSTSNVYFTKNCVLSVAGDDGEDQEPVLDKEGSNGPSGKDAGSLCLVVENALTSSGLEQVTHLSAKGGKGGNGGDSQSRTGGQGGNAGNGGVIQVALKSLPATNLQRIEHFLRTKERPSSKELQSLKESIQKTIQEGPSSHEDKEYMTSLLSELKDNDNVLEVLADIDMMIRTAGDNDALRLFQICDVCAGIPGAGGNGKPCGKDGEEMKSGTRSAIQIGGSYDSVKKLQFVPYHPDQCEMLLHKAELLYFAGSVVPAGVIFKRLIDRLTPFQDLHESDPLKMAYDAAEDNLAMPKAVSRLQIVYRGANQLLTQMMAGNDYFNNSVQFVPRSSYQFDFAVCSEHLKNLKTVEDSYIEYQEAEEEQHRKLSQIQATSAEAGRLKAQANDDIQILKGMMSEIASLIQRYQPLLVEQHQKINNTIEEVKDELSRSFSLNFRDIVDALTMVAFAPNEFMFVLQAANLGIKGATQIPEDAGGSIDKSYMVERISTCGASLDDLTEAYHTVEDGKISIDDPGAGKLVMAKNDLMKVINTIKSQLSSSTLKQLQDQLDKYIKTVLARNESILRYNSCILKWNKCQNDLTFYKEQQDQLNSQAFAQLNPNLPALVNYMTRLYRDARMRTLQALDSVQRSLWFWAANRTTDVIHDTLGSSPFIGVTHALLSDINDDLLDKFRQFLMGMGQDATEYRNVKYLLQDREVERLKSYNQVLVTIEAVGIDEKKETSPFVGWCNVRVYRAIVYFDNVITADNELQIRLRQFGRETIVDQSSNYSQFTHNPVEVSMRYHIDDKSIISEPDFGKPSSPYAPIGPFADWEITVDPNCNIGLDLSQVKSCWMEFSGIHQSFSL